MMPVWSAVAPRSCLPPGMVSRDDLSAPVRSLRSEVPVELMVGNRRKLLSLCS